MNYDPATLILMLDDAYEMPTAPDRAKFPKYKEDVIIDVDQTVRWNREQVKLANEAFKNEASRLQSARQAKINEVIENVYDYIISSISVCTRGYEISRKKAAVIWRKAYEDGHHSGTHSIFSHLEEYIDLICEVLKKD